MISTLILTRNEEADLPGCLESVAWCDDVHVFDSCSTDKTAEIARSRGANFTQREFDGYASQRNAACVVQANDVRVIGAELCVRQRDRLGEPIRHQLPLLCIRVEHRAARRHRDEVWAER